MKDRQIHVQVQEFGLIILLVSSNLDICDSVKAELQ